MNGRFFEEPVIHAEVSLADKEAAPLEVDGKGALVLEEQPKAFNLAVALPSYAIVTKRVTRQGVYADKSQNILSDASSDLQIVTTSKPIQISRVGKNVWIPWHEDLRRGHPGNELDCWLPGKDGKLDLFQVGVVTHDDGKTFRLLGEYRWRGQLFRSFRQDHPEGVIGRPAEPRWGSFKSRKKILFHPDIKKWLSLAKLALWEGKDEELEPPFGPIPAHDMARISWYSPFGGQTGQGIAVLQNSESVWVYGKDILDAPDVDGIQRLYFNQLVIFGAVRITDKGQSLVCVERR